MKKFLVAKEDVTFDVFFQDCDECDGHWEEYNYPKGTYFECDYSDPRVYLDLDGDGMLYVKPSLCDEIEIDDDNYSIYSSNNVVWQE